MHVAAHSGRKGASRAGEVGRLARSQHGVVARSQLIELGMSASGVDAWVERERLQVVLRGVYSIAHAPLTRRGWLMAAVLASGRGAVASHRTAASLWELLPDNRAAIDVTVPNRRRPKGPVVLHVSRLRSSDHASVDGIPVTGIPRTLADIAPCVPRWRLSWRQIVYEPATVIAALERTLTQP